MTLPAELSEKLFPNPSETFTWGEWKEGLKTSGVTITNEDLCPYTDDRVLTASEASQALERCTFDCSNFDPDPEVEEEGKLEEAVAAIVAAPDKAALLNPTLGRGPVVVKVAEVAVEAPDRKLKRSEINEWRREFQKYYDHPPMSSYYLKTEDDSPIKLEIVLSPGKPPFICTRAYVPMVVGAKLGWFAQKQGDRSSYGWKVILLPKSRDEAVKRFGLQNTEIYVKTLKIIKMADTGRSLLAEIAEW